MVTVAEKSKALEDRLIKLSANTIKSIQGSRSIPQSVKSQLIRSVSSVGANYAEANNASSKADFRNKIYIAKKEAAESIYWIRVIREMNSDDYLLQNEFLELNEIIKIFQKTLNTIKNGSLNEK